MSSKRHSDLDVDYAVPAVVRADERQAFLARGGAYGTYTPGGGAEPEIDEGTLPLSHYFWTVRRHRYKILVFIAASVLATYVVSSRMTPIYEATATIDIDRHTPQGIVGQEAQRIMGPNDSDQFIATQIGLIQSDSVLRPVAERYKLREHERQKLETPSDPVRTAEAPVVLKSLAVRRLANTYLLKLSYRSPNPQLAADVANAITRSYIEHTYHIRINSSQSLSSFMQTQMDELRAKMERSSQALVNFERELNVINPEEKTSILSARLLQLNQEYTSAQADRVRKEAAWNQAQGGSLEAAQVSTQGEALKRLQERLNEADESFARIKQQYGSQHPEYRKAAAQVSTLKGQLDGTVANILRRIETEYRESMAREKMLERAVTDTKKDFDRLNSRSYQYQQLKRDAENDKKLYDELLRRVNEAGINAGFQNNSIRFADVARPPVRPVAPNIFLNVLLALVVSSMLAVGVALLSDSLDKTIRNPEQVQQTLGTQVIGTLPIAKGQEVHAAMLSLGKNGAESNELVPAGDQALSLFEEAVRTLHSSILLSELDQGVRSLLVTSSAPGEGKSTTAAHLAMSHASLGKKTLLIDADLRRPSQHRQFNTTSNEGLSNVLLGEVHWKQALTPNPVQPKLDMLFAGPPSRRAPDLIGGGLSRLLDEAGREYDLIVLDSPPLMNFAEPLHMATSVDGVVLVAVAGETSKRAAAAAISTLKRLRVKIVGLVLNKVTREISDDYHYYGNYGKYYKRYYRPE